MPQFLNINGRITEIKDALGFQNRAFQYGDGLFETIRIISGKAILLDRHFQRLNNGLNRLKIKNHLDFRSFSVEVEKCIQVNKINMGGRLRITAFRESGGYYSPTDNKLGYCMEVQALSQETYELNSQGLGVDICEDIELPIDQFSNLKTLNALPYVMAGIYKKENGLDDVLLLNSEGNICEGNSSNVFLVAGNTLLTPSLDQGCVAGVMRSLILEIAENAGMRVVQARVRAEEMEIAEEVFFTNAIKGIQWVGAFRKKRYFNSTSKKLMAALNMLFP